MSKEEIIRKNLKRLVIKGAISIVVLLLFTAFFNSATIVIHNQMALTQFDNSNISLLYINGELGNIRILITLIITTIIVGTMMPNVINIIKANKIKSNEGVTKDEEV